jgi:hypothetical protein
MIQDKINMERKNMKIIFTMFFLLYLNVYTKKIWKYKIPFPFYRLPIDIKKNTNEFQTYIGDDFVTGGFDYRNNNYDEDESIYKINVLFQKKRLLNMLTNPNLSPINKIELLKKSDVYEINKKSEFITDDEMNEWRELFKE